MNLEKDLTSWYSIDGDFTLLKDSWLYRSAMPSANRTLDHASDGISAAAGQNKHTLMAFNAVRPF